jgi:hypothetical protein
MRESIIDLNAMDGWMENYLLHVSMDLDAT